MGQVVATNIASINAQRNLTKSGNSLATSLQRLSSGLRINSAKDDAAGLQISNQLTSQIRGMTVAARNASDGISMAQIAEGAMDEVTNIFQRMREIAVQSANGTNSTNERIALDSEFQALSSEVARIAQNTRFGNTSLLSGGLATTLQVSDKGGETIGSILNLADFFQMLNDVLWNFAMTIHHCCSGAHTDVMSNFMNIEPFLHSLLFRRNAITYFLSKNFSATTR